MIRARPAGTELHHAALALTVIRGDVTDQRGRARRLTAVPYYAWSNRGPGQLAVWFPRAGTIAAPRGWSQAAPAPAKAPGWAPPEAPAAGAPPAAPARP